MKNFLFGPVLCAALGFGAASSAYAQQSQTPAGAPSSVFSPTPFPATAPAAAPAAATAQPAAQAPSPASSMPPPGGVAAGNTLPPDASDIQIQKQVFSPTPEQPAGTLQVPAEGFGGVAVAPEADAGAPPRKLDGEDVAMIYFRLAAAVDKKDPDFKALAMSMDDYKNAIPFERTNKLNSLIDEMKGFYEHLSFSESVALRLPVHLSAYSRKSGGFVITDFEEQPVVKFAFADRNFAIIPREVADHEFLEANEKDAAAITQNAGPKSAYTMMVYVDPDYADSMAKTTEIDGVDYHVVSGKVSKVELWDVDEKHKLWSDHTGKGLERDDDPNSQKSIELLKQ